MTQAIPALSISQEQGSTVIRASGDWLVQTLSAPGQLEQLQAVLSSLADRVAQWRWELGAIGKIDHLGAQFFWNFWGRRRPAHLHLGAGQDAFFDRLYHLGDSKLPRAPHQRFAWVVALGDGLFRFLDHLLDFTRLIGQVGIDFLRLLRNPLAGPWREVSSSIYQTGAQALGITALVGFLIGVVLSYLSSQQLRLFGADIYIVNILGLAIIRELGPMLAAILVAGRSGSAITAQLGVMRVTEELDAMLVMGIPHGFRLILPKVIALAIAMPLIVIWTDAMALIGGMVSAKTSLGLSFGFFIDTLPNVVKLPNLWIGIGKGVVFGVLIALTACHYGLRIEPNTRSLGQGTTASVVTAITIVILADAVFAILFKSVGI